MASLLIIAVGGDNLTVRSASVNCGPSIPAPALAKASTKAMRIFAAYFVVGNSSVLCQKFDERVGTPFIVIPAHAGIQMSFNSLDSGSR